MSFWDNVDYNSNKFDKLDKYLFDPIINENSFFNRLKLDDEEIQQVFFNKYKNDNDMKEKFKDGLPKETVFIIQNNLSSFYNEYSHENPNNIFSKENIEKFSNLKSIELIKELEDKNLLDRSFSGKKIIPSKNSIKTLGLFNLINLNELGNQIEYTDKKRQPNLSLKDKYNDLIKINFNNENSEKSEIINNLEKQKIDLKNKILILENKIQILEEKINDLKKSFNNDEFSIENNEKELKNYETKNETKKENNVEKQETKKEKKTIEPMKSPSIETLKSKGIFKDKPIDKIDNKLKINKRDINTIEKEIDFYTNEKNKNKEKINKNMSFLFSYGESKTIEQRKQIHKENETLTNKNKNIDNKLKELKKEKNELEKTNKKVENKKENNTYVGSDNLQDFVYNGY